MFNKIWNKFWRVTWNKEIFKTLSFRDKLCTVYAVTLMNLGLPVWTPKTGLVWVKF